MMKYSEISKDDIDTVDKLVEVNEDGCFVFPYLEHQGYPQLQTGGRYILVHRMVKSYQLEKDLRSDEIVHHKCGNKSCVNPNHLQVLTAGEHITVHHQKLSPEDVGWLLSLHKTGDRTLADTVKIADVFFDIKCSASHLSNLLNGKTRKKLVDRLNEVIDSQLSKELV